MKNLTIHCKDFELTGAIQNYAEEKMTHLYKYLACEPDTVSFNLRVGKVTKSHNNGKIYFAEVSIHTAHKNYGGRVESEDIYVAIDLLKDELTNNICNYKDKARTLDIKAAQKFKHELHKPEADEGVV